MTITAIAKKWVAIGASMSLAVGLGVAGFSYANSAANATDDVSTVPVTPVFNPANFHNTEQRFHYDSDGHLTRLDYDMLNMHLREPQWHFLNEIDAREGETAEAFGRKFVYTDRLTLKKGMSVVTCDSHHTPGFWAPVDAKGKIDHRYGAWGVAGKSTCEIGVGRLIYWDGSSWNNQSHFKVDYIDMNSVHGYKVDAFREPSLGFTGTVDGNYKAGWPSLMDDQDKQRLVSAAAYGFAHDGEPDYALFKSFVGKNSERRGDLILQLAFGTDIASSAEKVLIYKDKYAEMVERVKNMVAKGFVTPGEALSGKFHITKTAASNDTDTVFNVRLDKLGNGWYQVKNGQAVFTFKPIHAERAAVTAPQTLTIPLADLVQGKDIKIPAGLKAEVKFATQDIPTPGAYVNRTSSDGTSIVVEAGVSAHSQASFELVGKAEAAKPSTKPTTTQTSKPATKPTTKPTATTTAPVPPATSTTTQQPVKPQPTATKTVTQPGPTGTVVNTVKVPGPTETVNVPGPKETVKVPGPTQTVVNTVKVPGPKETVVNTVKVPGPTETVKVPGPTETVKVPGAKETVKVPGPTKTIKVPGDTSTVHDTVKVPGPTKTVVKVIDPSSNQGANVAQGSQAIKTVVVSDGDGSSSVTASGSGHHLAKTGSTATATLFFALALLVAGTGVVLARRVNR